MKLVLLVACLGIALAGRSPYPKNVMDALRSLNRELPNAQYQGMEAFEKYMKKYHKSYQTDVEKLERYFYYEINMLTAQKLQAKEKGSATYGESPYADMSSEEFRQKYTSARWEKPSEFDQLPHLNIPANLAIPTNFDWRKKNAVTAVKNQQQCGSCWAFSTTGNIEGQWAIHKKKLISLSEQELVDCDQLDSGCEGGLPLNAYSEIIRLGGLESEQRYPYTAEDDQCQFNKKYVVAYINGSIQVSQDEGQMAQVLYQHGPLSIGLNADVMQMYTGGISHPDPDDCDPSALDHGVLIVGYGVQGSTPFWIIKNSWGGDWGEQGYWRAYRGDGVCGLNQMVTSATIA